MIDWFMIVHKAYVVDEDPGNSGPMETDVADDRFPSSKDCVAVLVSIGRSTTTGGLTSNDRAGNQKLKTKPWSWFSPLKRRHLASIVINQWIHPSLYRTWMWFLVKKGKWTRRDENSTLLSNDQCACVSFSTISQVVHSLNSTLPVPESSFFSRLLI